LVAFIAVARFSVRASARKPQYPTTRGQGAMPGTKKNILTAADNFQIVQKVKINFHPLPENNKPGDRPQ
jgi:hypothetical protein